MVGFRKFTSGAVLLAALFSLVGCNAGGDGGSDEPYSVSPTSIAFTAIENTAAPAPQYAYVKVNSGTVYLDLDTTGTGFSVSRQITGDTTAKITITPVSPTMSPGTYTGKVLVYGCKDQWCGEQVSGSPKTIDVSYTIKPKTGLTAAPTELTFTQIATDLQPQSQTLELSDYVADLSYGWSATVNYGSGSNWLKLNGASSAQGSTLPASLSISTNPVSTLGTYQAVIHISGNSRTVDVPVSYSVREPQLTVPADAAFEAYSFGSILPAANRLDLTTELGIPVDYSTSVNYGAGASGWLNIPQSGTAPGAVDLGVSSTQLAPGTYTATVSFATATQTSTVGVTYTVLTPKLTLNPGQLGFAVDRFSVSADLSQSIAIGDTGGTPMPWNVTSSQPWLSAGPSSGQTAGDGSTQSIVVSLVPSELENLDPGTHNAALTFSYTRPDTTTDTYQLNVALQMSVPKVSFVAPYVIMADTPETAVIRGKGFTGLTRSEVSVGTTPPASLQVVSDTEMRATLDPLTAQTYSVTVPNALGLNRSGANLVAVAPQTYGVATFNSVGKKTRVVFDDERGAFYVVNTNPDTAAIERYRYDAVSGWVKDSTSVASIRDAALTPDGASLLAVSDYTVRTIDALDLSVKQSVAHTGNGYLRQVAFANDGTAVIATGCPSCSGSTYVYKYDLLAGTLVTIEDYPAGYAYNATIGSPADGTRVIIGENGVYPAQQLRYYDASANGQILSTITYNLRNVVLDGHASRVIANNTDVLDSNLGLLGNLPSSTTAAVISYDGTVAYTYTSAGTVRKFDLTGALVSGEYPEIGTATLVDAAPLSAASQYSSTPPPVMAISRDGNTLVLAGDEKVTVIPAP